MWPSQHGQDVVFPDETGGQSDATGPLEPLDCHQLLGRSVQSFVDFSVGALCHSFQQRVLLSHVATLHPARSINLSCTFIIQNTKSTVDLLSNIQFVPGLQLPLELPRSFN